MCLGEAAVGVQQLPAEVVTKALVRYIDLPLDAGRFALFRLFERAGVEVVGAAQHGGVHTLIRTMQAQAVSQHPDAVDVVPQRADDVLVLADDLDQLLRGVNIRLKKRGWRNQICGARNRFLHVTAAFDLDRLVADRVPVWDAMEVAAASRRIANPLLMLQKVRD